MSLYIKDLDLPSMPGEYTGTIHRGPDGNCIFYKWDPLDIGGKKEYEVIPAADVKPVVLCRDCKNNYNTCLNHGINEPMCDFTDRKLREDDFCSRGEKREKS